MFSTKWACGHSVFYNFHTWNNDLETSIFFVYPVVIEKRCISLNKELKSTITNKLTVCCEWHTIHLFQQIIRYSIHICWLTISCSTDSFCTSTLDLDHIHSNMERSFLFSFSSINTTAANKEWIIGGYQFAIGKSAPHSTSLIPTIPTTHSSC